MGPKIEKVGSKTEKMGKKAGKSYNKSKSRVTKDLTSVSEEQEEEDLGPKPPYHDLMFHPIIPDPLPARKVQTTKIPVLKKRLRGSMFLLQLKDIGSAIPSAQSIANSPLSTRSQVDLFEVKSAGAVSMTLSTLESKSHTQFQTLNPTVCKPKPLPLWHPPVKGIENVQVALQRERTGTRSYKDVQRNSLRKERLSLATFELEKQKQFQFENFLMKKTGKSRGNLLLRRQQLQPHTESTGRERPIICRELVHSPSPQKPPILNLFCEHGNPGYHRKDLTLTLTKRQRGFKVITEWLGAPHLTDTIVKLLGVDPRESIKRLGEVQKSAGFHPDRGDHFVPVIPELAVVGVPCKERFSHWNHVDTKKVGKEHIKHNKPHFLDTHSKRGGRIYRTSTKIEKKNLRGVVSVNFGGEHLAWRGPQCESDTNLAEKVFVIEINCSAVLGKNTMGSTTISNTGTVAINYHWVQLGREHNFDLNINKMHFAFDCWGGLLLPGETHRVPAMYRAKEKGFFSEDWRLVTAPVLEAGAPIILRLSGVTRHSITYLRRIKDLDQKIRILIRTSIVEDRVCEIVRSLSSKNLHQKDVSFADHRNGNEQFEWKNPGYYYHSAAVYRLGKLAELLETHFDRKLRLVSRDHSAIFSKSGSSDQSPDIEVASEIMLATETGSALQSFSQPQTKLSSLMSLGTREPTIMHGTSETLVYTQASDMINKEEAKEHEFSINDEDEFTSLPDYFYRSSFRVTPSYFVQEKGAQIYQILMKCSDMDLLGMSKNREKDMKKGAKKILKEKAMLSLDKKQKQVIGGSSRESSRALKSKGSSTKSGELSGDRSGTSLRASNPSSPTVRGHRVPSRDKSGNSTTISNTSSPRNSNLRNASTSIRNLNFSHNNSNSQLYKSIDSKEGSLSSLRDRETEDRPMNSWLNVVDTDIQIDSLRSQILQDSRLEVKEAAFDVMNDALYKLSFRPVEPLENWKLVTGFTNLCSTIDAFNDFAVRLKSDDKEFYPAHPNKDGQV